LLDAKTKTVWIEEKKKQDENLTEEERRERDSKRNKGPIKHFSAYKEMERMKHSKKEYKKDNGKGKGRRGGREGRPRDRSRSPAPVEESDPAETTAVETVTGEKRPAEEEISASSNKREKLDDTQNGKRGAEEELNGETKKLKVDGQ
jgi:hypothetical protein